MLARDVTAIPAPKSEKPRRPNRTQRRSIRRHRRVVKGAVYLVTKKCSRDEFLIRPSSQTNQILLYVLIDRARKYGVELIAFCFLANHFHLVIRDVRGRMPDFMRDFLKQTSSAIRVAEGDDRRVWSQKRYSAVELLDLDAGLRKCGYTELNPYRANLTRPEDWPGLTSSRFRAGDIMTATRPDAYFSDRRPECVSLPLTSIASAFGLDSEDDIARVERELADMVERELKGIERTRKPSGSGDSGRELGPARVLEQSRDQRGNTRVLERNPRFASRNPMLLRSAIAEYEDFEARHERARDRWIAGQRNAAFPSGTFGFRWLYGVRVDEDRKVA